MKIYECYFSPTGTTEKTIKKISYTLSDMLKIQVETINFTSKSVREKSYFFESNDIVIIGTPVYAGRVPNILLNFLQNNIKSNGAQVICIVSFGNRNYDEALIELMQITKKNGFKILSSGAFIGEHSFSKILAYNRPDNDDFKFAKQLAENSYYRLFDCNFTEISIDMDYKLKPYYRPKDCDGKLINILKVKPKTKDTCNKCGICVSCCPMNAISKENPSLYISICIKCGACEKKCPIGAKYYDDEGYLYHKIDLEQTFSERKNPVIF